MAIKEKNHRLFRLITIAYKRFVKIRGNTNEIALGFSLGLFFSMIPIPSQTIAVIIIAAILKWNKIYASIGVQLTNPFTAPFIYGINYLIGRQIILLFDGQNLPPKFTLSLTKLGYQLPEIFLALFIGGIITGIPISIIGYYLAHIEITKYRQKRRNKKLKNTRK